MERSLARYAAYIASSVEMLLKMRASLNLNLLSPCFKCLPTHFYVGQGQDRLSSGMLRMRDSKVQVLASMVLYGLYRYEKKRLESVETTRQLERQSHVSDNACSAEQIDSERILTESKTNTLFDLPKSCIPKSRSSWPQESLSEADRLSRAPLNFANPRVNSDERSRI